MANPNCPWPFLVPLSSPPPPPPPVAPLQQRTFAQALTNSCDIPISQLPRPCLKGDSVSIKISEDEYKKGFEACKNNLHGRLVLAKGDSPVKFNDLHAKLSKLWSSIGKWKMIPLGKGYFEFTFSSQEDLCTVWSFGSWSLQPGSLRLFQWSANFTPSCQKQTHVQCWIRVRELPQEYWRPKTLFEIASSVGVPISLDEATKNKVFGHYARILVNIDLNGIFLEEVLVERDNYAFFVGIEYERLPSFCSFCQTIGHYSDQCRKKYGSVPPKHPIDNVKRVRQVYVSKNPNLDNEKIKNDGAAVKIHVDAPVAENINEGQVIKADATNQAEAGKANEDDAAKVVEPAKINVHEDAGVKSPINLDDSISTSRVDAENEKDHGVDKEDYAASVETLYDESNINLQPEFPNQDSDSMSSLEDASDIGSPTKVIDTLAKDSANDSGNTVFSPVVQHDLEVLADLWKKDGVKDKTDSIQKEKHNLVDNDTKIKDSVSPVLKGFPVSNAKSDAGFTVVLNKYQRTKLKKQKNLVAKENNIQTRSRAGPDKDGI